MPRLILAGLLALTACTGGEQSFSNTDDGSTGQQGTGVALVSPDTLEITQVGCEAVAGSGVFTITNVGDANLRIYTVDLADSADGVFYTEEFSDLELSPESTREFVVNATFDPAAVPCERTEGQVRIKTNDAEAIDFRLPVVAWPEEAEGEDDGGGGDDGGGDDGGGEDDTGDTGDAD